LKHVNANGKRVLVRPRRTHRQKTHLEEARACLETWRFKTVSDRYTPGPFTACSFLPDSVLKTLASASHIQTVEQLKSEVNWLFADRHGEELLAILCELDDWEYQQRQRVKEVNAEKRRAATAARREERRLQIERERLQKRTEADRLHAKKCMAAEQVKRDREARKQAKENIKPLPKRPR